MRCIHFLLEVVLSWWFLRKVSQCAETPHWRRVLGFACLVIGQTHVVFITTGYLSNVLRMAIRCASFYGYLRLSKAVTRSHSLYFAAFATLCFTIAHNIWNALPYVSLPMMASITPFPFLDVLLVLCLLRYAVVALVLLIPYKLIPFDEMPGVTRGRALFLSAAIILMVYLKESVFQLDPIDGTAHWNFSFHLILLNLFILLFVVAIERMAYSNEERTRLALQEAANESRLRSAEANRQHEDAVRRLHHDMKMRSDGCITT